MNASALVVLLAKSDTGSLSRRYLLSDPLALALDNNGRCPIQRCLNHPTSGQLFNSFGFLSSNHIIRHELNISSVLLACPSMSFLWSSNRFVRACASEPPVRLPGSHLHPLHCQAILQHFKAKAAPTMIFRSLKSS